MELSEAKRHDVSGRLVSVSEMQKIRKNTREAHSSQTAPFPSATGLYGEPIGKGAKAQLKILRYLATIAHPQVVDRKEIAAGAPCDLPYCTSYIGSSNPSIRTKNDSKIFPSLISRGLVECVEISGLGQTRNGYRLTALGRTVTSALPLSSAGSTSAVSTSSENPPVTPSVPTSVANEVSRDELHPHVVIDDPGLDRSHLGMIGNLNHDNGTVPAWVMRLLASPVFADQKRLGGRGIPTDAVLAQLLTVLNEQGGKLTRVALARRLEFPEIRLPGLLAKAEQVLNVDGYDILRRDASSDTIELNRDLLLMQFDLI